MLSNCLKSWYAGHRPARTGYEGAPWQENDAHREHKSQLPPADASQTIRWPVPAILETLVLLDTQLRTNPSPSQRFPLTRHRRDVIPLSCPACLDEMPLPRNSVGRTQAAEPPELNFVDGREAALHHPRRRRGGPLCSTADGSHGSSVESNTNTLSYLKNGARYLALHYITLRCLQSH